MNKVIIIILIAVSVTFAQLPGIKLDFNDGTITGWNADHPRTFQLSAADSALKINYTRTGSSEQWDNFNYTPPDLIDPASNPVITLRVKSDVSSVLTFKPIYSNGSDDWLQQSISNDNQWHELQYNLVNYKGTTLNKIYLYLDGGSTAVKSGVVYFDDVVIGSDKIVLQVSNLKAEVIDSSQVNLTWDVNFPNYVNYFKIYRGLFNGFVSDQSTLVDSTSSTGFLDAGLTVNTPYYYKVTAVDLNGVESEPSPQVKAFTAGSGNSLAVVMESINSETLGLYQVFEIVADILGAQYDNPFDPQEVDLGAIFVSPSGVAWNINGFYDNVDNRNQWKIRFSPNEQGTWTYKLRVANKGFSAESESYTFGVVDSDYHGWIRAAEKNPHYFQHDDGTSFYGVGVYYPWRVTEEGLETLSNYSANIWGYWNITYDDGTVIESLNSGLGRYDQKKCGRIDQLLEWSAERDMKMMIAIWPHDLISNTVWSHQWDKNPYKDIVDVKNFFDDELAWSYQQKQYRYLIARWSAYRSLGIWEIVNEINGTDAWVSGKSIKGAAWVKKVHDYFKVNDPYQHPTTASQSGGKFWTTGYNNVDVPNVHLYETGWQNYYPNNPLRASLVTYRLVSNDLWNKFLKPSIMGEAGYENSYGQFAFPSPEYTALYHNALWTTWSSGNASTPFWWDFNRRDIISDDVLAQMKAFSQVASQIDYVNNPVERKLASASGCDAFVMVGDSLAYGWIREVNGNNVAGKQVTITGVVDTSFSIQIINTWNGSTFATQYVAARDSMLIFTLPEFEQQQPDVAFILRVVDGSLTGVEEKRQTLVPNDFALSQNYPNPFNPVTTIEYSVAQSGKVTVSVFNSNGQLVKQLVDENQDAGHYSITWDGSGMASGLYLYRIKAGQKVITKKALLLK